MAAARTGLSVVPAGVHRAGKVDKHEEPVGTAGKRPVPGAAAGRSSGTWDGIFGAWDVPVLRLDFDAGAVRWANASARQGLGLGDVGPAGAWACLFGADPKSAEALVRISAQLGEMSRAEWDAVRPGLRLRLWRDAGTSGLGDVWALGIPSSPVPGSGLFRQALHDLRIPLTSIRYSEELLRRHELPAAAAKYIGVIRDSAERMSNQMAELSRRLAGGE